MSGNLTHESRLAPTFISQINSPSSSPVPESPGRCKIAMVKASGQQCFTSEIHCLLRSRLRMAALIMGLGFAAFLPFLIWDTTELHPDSFKVAFHALVAVAALVLAGMLWSPWQLCLPSLRRMELFIFGMAAAYFAFVQATYISSGRVLVVSNPGFEHDLFMAVCGSNAARWFVLIVLYGTFIPNTWRRCAAVVGLLVLIPNVVSVGGLVLVPAVRPFWVEMLIQSNVMLAMGTAIAIFGSYKISALHQEAFEARKLGQYVLKRPLGAGGMGEVYLAEHLLLRRPCAVKLIRPEQAGDPKMLNRFEREVQATARLTHWNTVEIYDYGHAADGTFYYVMEYLPGLSLQELVEKHGPLDPARVVHLLQQVCAGLREAHQKHLLHRDVKPSNILICERGGVHDVAKVLDFGLVKTVGFGTQSTRLTQEGTLAGSPMYMSPEQANGKDQLDARSDLYNVGAVAYFLLTGQPPFQRESPLEMMFAHLREPVIPPRAFRPEISDDLQAVVLRCLEKDPAKRFQDADGLRKALVECAGASHWTEEQATEWWRTRQSEERSEVEPEADGLALTATLAGAIAG